MKTKQVWTASFGMITVNSGDSTYNGHTMEEIKNMPFLGWDKEHKIQYINNCREIIESQLTGRDEGHAECLKNTNFNLVNFYLNK